MTDETPKILDGGPVVFGPSTAQADLLNPENTQSASAAPSSTATIDQFEKEAFARVIGVYKDFVKAIDLRLLCQSDKALMLIPYCVEISYTKTPSSYNLNFTILPIKFNILENILKEIYGNFISQTDMLKGFNMYDKVDLLKLSFAEEFFGIIPRSSGSIKDTSAYNNELILDNPYLAVLMAPQEHRPFIAGAIHNKITTNNIPLNINTTRAVCYQHGLNLENILSYAEKKGVKDIADIYKIIKTIPSIK